jgi:hypothetical protein
MRQDGLDPEYARPSPPIDRGGHAAATATATLTREQLAALPDSYFKAVDAKDVDAILSHFADDERSYIGELVDGRPVRARDAAPGAGAVRGGPLGSGAASSKSSVRACLRQ